MARGHSGQGNPYGAMYMLLSLLSTGLCIAILVIVNQYLWYGASCGWVGNTYICFAYDICYMQTASSQADINLCYYSWAAAGVGLFFALCVFFMQVCSGRNRHIPICEVLICVLALLWWIGAATTATVYGQNADNEPVTDASTQTLDDKTGYRTSVWAMGWACVGLWAICAVVSLKDCVSTRRQPPPAQGGPAGAYTQQANQPYYYTAPPPPAGYGGYPPAGAPAYPPAGAPAYPPAGAPGYPPQQSPFASGGAPPAGYPPAQAV